MEQEKNKKEMEKMTDEKIEQYGQAGDTCHHGADCKCAL